MNFRNPRARGRGRSAVTIDITPLIDVVFLLLIFLLITTTFKRNEHAFPIELPTSSVKQITITTDKTTIFIAKDGALHLLEIPADAAKGTSVSTRTVTRAELETKLDALNKHNPDAPISIRAEKDTRYQRMIDVVSLVEKAGFRNIWFPYELEGGK